MSEKVKITDSVKKVLSTLKNASFSAYLVGGCVRDLLRNSLPSDWDIATNAKPEEIQKLFPDSVYENNFGTVGVKIRSKNKTEVLEVTTFRKDVGYSDKRHPDKIEFANTIEEDLSRRDFTINAMALEYVSKTKFAFVDIYNGAKDLQNKLIRAVGDSDIRFNEDALRMMRAVRFFSQLEFKIDKKTEDSIKNNAKLLQHIAEERIRDEFVKIIMSKNSANGIVKLHELELLQWFIPEIIDTIGVEQNLHHIYTVWEHLIRSLEYSSHKNYSLEVRLASFFHDIGKHIVKRGEGRYATFYNHEVVSAKITKKILERMKFSAKVVKDVTHLVRQHQFSYDVGEVSDAGVRRFIRRVGIEYIDDLIKVREADRIGSGVPKAVPYKLRHLLFMVEKVRKDPISLKMLKINGDEIMKITKLKPSPKLGMILNALMKEVIDDPKKNTKKFLKERTLDLSTFNNEDLTKISDEGKKKKALIEEKEEDEIKKKFWVK